MRITNVNGGSNCYSYYNASTTHAVVTYSRIGLIAVGPENESINFSTVVDGVSLNSLGTTNKLYLY